MKKTTFLILFFANLISAQTPCANGFAGVYPCNGYDLLANMPVNILANTNGNPEGSDLWGWTDSTTGKEYAIAAMTNSTAFVDVTDPLNPIFLGRLDSNAGNNYWRDVKVYKNHAFIVADNVGAHGMQIFDLTRLRGLTSAQNFTADKIFTEVTSCHNIIINEESGFAYLLGCNTFNGGPVFVNISDPKNPVSVGGYSSRGYTHDAQIVTYNGPDSDYTGKEIFIGSNGNDGGTNDVVILDITDKSSPKFISKISYQNARYTHQGWFTEDQRFFILGDELDELRVGMNSRSLIFDFLDLDNPKLSSTYSGPSAAIDHNGYVKGNLYYMANYRAGIRVLDISNIAAATNSMTEVGFFDTYPANNSTAFNGAWSVYPYFASGNIIVNDIERGLFVIRKSGTLSTNNQNLSTNFSVFPNPASTKITIKGPTTTTIKNIRVYNVLGQKVFEIDNISQTKYVLNTESFKSGFYHLKINESSIQKIIINN